MDFSFENKNFPEKGSLLLSDPFEQGLHFTRSVVIVCSYDTHGALGLVLNNYISIPAADIHPNLKHYLGQISIGGPMEKNSLFYIHQFEGLSNSMKIKDDLYFGGDFDQLIKCIEQNSKATHQARFCVGYSGWAFGQIEEELNRNAWIVVNDYQTNELMDSMNKTLWHDLMKKQGAKYEILSNFPLDPNNN